MTHQTLIAYASRCGSTREIAEAIAHVMTERGATVAVQRADTVASVAAVDAVIVASPIRMGTWLPEAVKFVERNALTLRQMPTAFVTAHMLNADESDASRAARAAYLDAVHQHLTATTEVFFSGKLELAKMSWLDRLISSAMKAKDEDKRDWPAIQAWAQTVWA